MRTWISLIVALTINLATVADLHAVCLGGWSYRKPIVINHVKVASSLKNFPVLVSVTDQDLRLKALTDASDVMFADSNGNYLSHELETYDSTTGHIEAWVKVPTLDPVIDTTIYMYYGNLSAGTGLQQPASVWDQKFRLVDHLGDPIWSGNPVLSRYVNLEQGILIGCTCEWYLPHLLHSSAQSSTLWRWQL